MDNDPVPVPQPGYMGIGGLTDEPGWLCLLSIESLILAVSRSPTDRVEIAEVAVEQYAYCDDLGRTVGETWQVARLQVPGDRWSFWWDCVPRS
jgi:hypothetical protein